MSNNIEKLIEDTKAEYEIEVGVYNTMVKELNKVKEKLVGLESKCETLMEVQKLDKEQKDANSN